MDILSLRERLSILEIGKSIMECTQFSITVKQILKLQKTAINYAFYEEALLNSAAVPLSQNDIKKETNSSMKDEKTC